MTSTSRHDDTVVGPCTRAYVARLEKEMSEAIAEDKVANEGEGSSKAPDSEVDEGLSDLETDDESEPELEGPAPPLRDLLPLLTQSC